MSITICLLSINKAPPKSSKKNIKGRFLFRKRQQKIEIVIIFLISKIIHSSSECLMVGIVTVQMILQKREI
jgi:accessory gene regulator protein AgrB